MIALYPAIRHIRSRIASFLTVTRSPPFESVVRTKTRLPSTVSLLSEDVQRVNRLTGLQSDERSGG